ncbi:MAG: GerAB/ArcD/ProY family transporter [Clostridiales bacterium]|jgi:spore germination protein (amino acid permease)|nr:spore germination protein [Eubacteriales bacterium]MDH7566654.1 GerAB/ArcD/ProY family transporter [Clostridiales bacterium]
MMQESKIVFGKWETAALLINALNVQVFLNFPRTMAERGGTAGWILAAYISVLAFLLFLLISRLYSRFEGKDLLDLGEYIGGSAGRIIVGIIILIHITFIISIILREFAEDMKVISLPASPISFVILFFLSGMIAGAYAGIEAIVRFHAFIVPIILAGYLIIIGGVAPYYNISNIMPILGNGAYAIFGSGFFRISSFSGLIALFLLFPFIKTGKNFKSAGSLAIGISSGVLITSALTFLLVFPYPSAIEGFLPIFQLARLINYGRFFQRVESIFVMIWAIAALLYLSMGFFLIVYVFSKTFRLEYYRPLIIPMAIIVFAISLWPKNLMSAIAMETVYFRSAAWAVTFGMTLLLLLVAGAMKKRNHRKEGDRK